MLFEGVKKSQLLHQIKVKSKSIHLYYDKSHEATSEYI